MRTEEPAPHPKTRSACCLPEPRAQHGHFNHGLNPDEAMVPGAGRTVREENSISQILFKSKRFLKELIAYCLS